jgi:membrane-bound ClpP family serine protease
MATRKRRNDALEKAYARLEKLLPDKPAQALNWLHRPTSKYVRMPLGIFFIAASFFFILPVIGLEWLPLGLLLVAQDIPFLREPVGKAVLPMIGWVEKLEKKWKAWRDA